MSRSAQIYNFVYDIEQIKRFARLIQTENNPHILYLNSRPKYNKEVKQDMLATRLFYNQTDEQFVDLVRSFEIEYGSYKQNNLSLPSDALVIYCTTNGSDIKKACRKLVQELIDSGFGNSLDTFNLQSRVISCLMSSKIRCRILSIDIDDKKEYDVVKEFMAQENIPIIATIETRGGFHVLFYPNNNTEKVYKRFNKEHTIGDIACAVPGTYQGGYPVRFVD